MRSLMRVLMRVLTASAVGLLASLPVWSAGDPPAATDAASAATALIDINRATEAELVALKGIGEVRAAAIIQGRPWARKDDLVRQGVIPESVYQDIKDQIIAKR